MAIHIHIHRNAEEAVKKLTADSNEYEHFGDDTIIRKAMQGDPKAKAEAKRRGIDTKKV